MLRKVLREFPLLLHEFPEFPRLCQPPSLDHEDKIGLWEVGHGVGHQDAGLVAEEAGLGTTYAEQ